MRTRFRQWMILAIIAAFALTGGTCAYAANGNTAAGHPDGLSVLNAPAALQEDSGQEYMPNAALVMFKTTKKLTKSEAKKSLRSGNGAVADVVIEDLWSFEAGPQMTVSEDGKAKMLKGSAKPAGSKTYRGVALVKSKTLSTEELIARMQARKDVLYAEPNYRIHACSVNDPYFPRQWSMQGGAEGTPEYSNVASNIGAFWDQGITGSERIVAVVDTGVDYTHPDLAPNMWHNDHYPVLKGEYGFDFIGGDDDPMDENGHGSHCAGILGATGNNGIGISGVNQNIKIMALRILDADGSAFMSHEVAAYNYINRAIDLGEPVQAINNSWGGGDYSDIFEELVTILGEKGALTVCAAGNAASDNDEVEDYPCNVDSPYLISVAATNSAGKLASFSNYGEETVDLAAPGADILSTVSYDCYNPGIYGSEQATVSEHFNDYETEPADGWGSPETLGASLYLNGEPYVAGEDKPEISFKIADGGFLDESGHALQIDVENAKVDDLICVSIPYEIDSASKEGPYYSVMGETYASKDEGGIFGILDVTQEDALDIDTLGNLPLQAYSYLFTDEPDNWDHMTFQAMGREAVKEAKDKDLKRQVVLLLYAYQNGSMHVRLDDMGLSLQEQEGRPVTSLFGKYDYYSGTSMATPFISGTVALKAEELQKESGEINPESLINEVTSMTRDEGLPVMQKGAIDFTKRPAEMSPRIGTIRVDQEKGTITVTGSGLNPSTGLTAEIGPDKDHLQTATILSASDNEVVLQDDGWINNVETIRLTGFNGRTATKSNQYMVKGKKVYSEVKDATDELPAGPMATDGRYIYAIDPYGPCVLKLDTKKIKRGVDNIGEIDIKKLFGKQQNRNARYAMSIGEDLAYMNGKLYAVIEYGEADESEVMDDDDFWFFSNTKGGNPVAYVRDEDEDEDEEEYNPNLAIYSGEFRLISVDVKSGKVKNLGKLPSELEKTVDYTMASYNGKLYFMGGYSYASKGLTDQIMTFDPSKKGSKRWASATPLPQVRAGGKALQSGSKLIYTLGYDTPLSTDADEADFHFPANMIFNGKTWKVSSIEAAKNIAPLTVEDTVTRGGQQYQTHAATIGAVKNGLVYFGVPAADYGDTFVYDAAADAYADTGYNFASSLDSNQIDGISVGSALYGFDGEKVYKAKATANNLVKVTVKKKGKGTVKGAGSYVPGSNVKITVKAAKGHKIKTIKVGSSTMKVIVKGSKYSFTLKNVVKNQKVTVVFK